MFDSAARMAPFKEYLFTFFILLSIFIPGVSCQGFFWSVVPNPPEVPPPPAPAPEPIPDDTPYPTYPNYMYMYGMWPDNQNQETCVCNCQNRAPTTEDERLGCEWKMVFKSVAGNGRSVYNDWTGTGNMNVGLDEAMQVTSTMPYRDGDIIEKWNQHYIQRVKVEIYAQGIRNTWFIFDATASDSESWMAPERLLASPYDDLKEGNFDIYSVQGESSERRRFQINRVSTDCSSKCGYFMVIDPLASHPCSFESAQAEPFFLFGTLQDSCGRWNQAGENSSGDRLVISLKICDVELSNSSNTVWVDPVQSSSNKKH